jgi:polyhydroxyalkanoate synthesis regulator phasin
MAQTPDWKQLLEAGMQFTEMRRAQARRVAADLVAQGQLARDQVQSAVDEIVEMSRRRTEELREIVRSEVQRQLGSLGLATKEDLARVERKLAKAPAKAPAKKAPATKAEKPAKKKAAKKAPAAAAKKAG